MAFTLLLNKLKAQERKSSDWSFFQDFNYVCKSSCSTGVYSFEIIRSHGNFWPEGKFGCGAWPEDERNEIN